jgi:hypothetical protein
MCAVKAALSSGLKVQPSIVVRQLLNNLTGSNGSTPEDQGSRKRPVAVAETGHSPSDQVATDTAYSNLIII